jgi:pyruvate, orthophosphate dikinase
MVRGAGRDRGHRGGGAALHRDGGTGWWAPGWVSATRARWRARGLGSPRHPATGEHRPYGDWLPGAQGEDVVAGIRITRHLDDLHREFPEQAAELDRVMRTLETHYRDMCDIEFTIERDRLWILQTRVGKRTAAAALQMAADMVAEGLIDKRVGVTRVTPAQLEQLLHPQFAPGVDYTPLTTGLNASPGAAVGRVVFTADEAERRAAAGEDVVLVRPETSPDDLHGMIAAKGILTSRGGLVSHAAVVARGMGKPAVCGAGELHIDVAAGEARVDAVVVRAGDVIAINGTTGEVVLGEIPLVTPEPTGPFSVVLGWADEFRRLGVRANADLPDDAVRARELGAERFQPDRPAPCPLTRTNVWLWPAETAKFVRVTPRSRGLVPANDGILRASVHEPD